MHVLQNAMSMIQRKKLYSCLSPLPKLKVGESLACERKSIVIDILFPCGCFVRPGAHKHRKVALCGAYELLVK